MYNKRILYIGLSLLNDAISHSKRKLEALAFALSIKSFFTNSQYYLKAYTYSEISKICQISTKKAKRVLEDVVNFGYAKWNENGDKLEFAKIKDEHGLNYKFYTNKITKKHINKQYIKKNDTNIDCLSLDYVVNELRKLHIQNHIQQKNFITNTIKEDAANNFKTVSQVKKHNKIMDKYGVRKDNIAGYDNGISIESFMRKINIKRRNKVKNLIDQLVFDDLIERKKNITYIGKCSLNTFYQSNEFGCYFSFNNNLYLKNRNEYTIKENTNFEVCYK